MRKLESALKEALYINRDILECKFLKLSDITLRFHQILIETYWNVNYVLFTLNVLYPVILIETYWNVNVVTFYILNVTILY